VRGPLVIGRRTGYPALVGQFVALGLGLGLVVPAMTTALLGSVATSRSGVASGALNTARQTGSVVGVAVLGSLAAGHLLEGLRYALGVSVALAAVLAGLSTTIPREQQTSQARRPARSGRCPRRDPPLSGLRPNMAAGGSPGSCPGLA
jgi:DHA2 family methylenomycin A resistance protein-like MFS transporter